MAKKPRRSKDDKKSKGLSALQEYANKLLVGEEAQGLFDEAGELPLNLRMAPNQGFRNPVPSGLTAGLLAKSGAYAKAGSKTNVAKFLGAEELMRLAGPSRSPKRVAGDVATLASFVLPFSPAKKMLGKSRDWLALINSFKAMEDVFGG